MSDSSSWPFSEPTNAMCFTVRSVVEGRKPLLMVYRGAEDEGWTFLTGENLDMSEALLVTLGSMIERDSSLLALADLAPGWTAVRDATSAPWKLSRDERAADDQGS